MTASTTAGAQKGALTRDLRCALRLSRRAANIWLAAVRLLIEGGTDSVTEAPEHTALLNATLATGKP
jgi:hypothetical protein